MFKDIILILAATYAFILGVPLLFGEKLREIGRARGYKLAICIGLIVTSLAVSSYSPSRTTSLKEGEAATLADSAIAASAEQVSASKSDAVSSELSGKSLKGDRYTVKKDDVSTKGIITRVKVSWLNLDGRTRQTVKGFQCGKELHSTLYRSDKPTKYDANTPDWYKVVLRGATREIYDWSCNVNSNGSTPNEGADAAAEKSGSWADKAGALVDAEAQADRSGKYDSYTSPADEALEDRIRELEDELQDAEQRAYAAEQRADDAEIDLRYK